MKQFADFFIPKRATRIIHFTSYYLEATDVLIDYCILKTLLQLCKSHRKNWTKDDDE